LFSCCFIGSKLAQQDQKVYPSLIYVQSPTSPSYFLSTATTDTISTDRHPGGSLTYLYLGSKRSLTTKKKETIVQEPSHSLTKRQVLASTAKLKSSQLMKSTFQSISDKSSKIYKRAAKQLLTTPTSTLTKVVLKK